MSIYESARNNYQRPLDGFQTTAIEHIIADSSPERILEVGCATGKLLNRFEELGCQAIGVDLSMSALQRVKGKTPVVQADGNELPFANDTFDLVVANHVVEHAKDVGKFVGELVRVARPEGKVFLSYPNEPIRGLFASLGSLQLFGHPFGGRRMHLHNVRPSDFDALSNELPFMHVNSRHSLLPMPQFFTTLSKK